MVIDADYDGLDKLDWLRLSLRRINFPYYRPRAGPWTASPNQSRFFGDRSAKLQTMRIHEKLVDPNYAYPTPYIPISERC